MSNLNKKGNKMKNLIVKFFVILAVISFIGCENNPISPVETDSKDKSGFFASIMILQEYYNDTLYIANMLYSDYLTEELGCFTNFITGDSTIIIDGVVVPSMRINIFYDSDNINGYYEIYETDYKRDFYGGGVDFLNLKYNYKYYFIWGVNK